EESDLYYSDLYRLTYNGVWSCCLYVDGTLTDILGVYDEKGTNDDWDFSDGHAVRNSDICNPNNTWDSSEWTLESGTISDMTPGEHS
ncbi:MAG: hypothetical protein PQJ60_01465, partial [Spirochaetales bacterium]|nr:hypothetical protein [Spirochaetales bacterium]